MTNNSRLVFASNLRKQLEIHGKTHADLTNELNLKQSTVSDWINGKKYPRIDKTEMLADYFDILKSDLTEQKTPPAKAEGDKNSARQEVLDLLENAPEESLPMLLATAEAIVAKYKEGLPK